jgi:uncharacterized protein YxjI
MTSVYLNQIQNNYEIHQPAEISAAIQKQFVLTPHKFGDHDKFIDVHGIKIHNYLAENFYLEVLQVHEDRMTVRIYNNSKLFHVDSQCDLLFGKGDYLLSGDSDWAAETWTYYIVNYYGTDGTDKHMLPYKHIFD